jgi:hypothetical protein
MLQNRTVPFAPDTASPSIDIQGRSSYTPPTSMAARFACIPDSISDPDARTHAGMPASPTPENLIPRDGRFDFARRFDPVWIAPADTMTLNKEGKG